MFCFRVGSRFRCAKEWYWALLELRVAWTLCSQARCALWRGGTRGGRVVVMVMAAAAEVVRAVVEDRGGGRRRGTATKEGKCLCLCKSGYSKMAGAGIGRQHRRRVALVDQRLTV